MFSTVPCLHCRSVLYYFDSAKAELTPVELTPKVKIRSVSKIENNDNSGLQLRKSEQNCFHDNFLISQPNPMM